MNPRGPGQMKVLFNNILRYRTVLTYTSCATVQAKREISFLRKMPGPLNKTTLANTPFDILETPVYTQKKATGKVFLMSTLDLGSECEA